MLIQIQIASPIPKDSDVVGIRPGPAIYIVICQAGKQTQKELYSHFDKYPRHGGTCLIFDKMALTSKGWSKQAHLFFLKKTGIWRCFFLLDFAQKDAQNFLKHAMWGLLHIHCHTTGLGNQIHFIHLFKKIFICLFGCIRSQL